MDILTIVAIIFAIALPFVSKPKILLYKKKFGAYTFKGFHLFFLCFLIMVGSAVVLKNKENKKKEEHHEKMVAWALELIKTNHEQVFGEGRDKHNQEHFVLVPDYYQTNEDLKEKVSDYF